MQNSPFFLLDSPHEVQEWHGKALEFLAQHEIPPSPVCHLLAYQFASRRSNELNNKIENKLASQETFDGFFLLRLFEEFCLDSVETDQIGDHLSDLQGLLIKVLEGVTSACSHTEQFNHTLQQQSQALKSNPSVADLRSIVSSLSNATSQAIKKNQTMREQLQVVEQQTNSLQSEVKKLREEVATDPLTGLYNRRALSQRMHQLLEEAERGANNPFSVLMVDIDHFKHFNDRFGHLIGDEVIRRVGITLREHLREEDFPARYGGEEFSVVLPAMGIDSAVDVARDIHQAVGNLVLVKRSTKERLPGITISVGAACLRHGDSCDSLLDRADQALYLAKQSGRNRIMSEAEISYM
jgi:diguanylate cyclase